MSARFFDRDLSSKQLIEKYTKDYRARGRGTYIVLWFGPIEGKQLTKHPVRTQAPTTPNEMRELLLAELKKDNQSNIDIVVLDLSPTV